MFGISFQDLTPVITSFFGALVGIVGAFFTWRQQSEKLRAELLDAQAKLQDADIHEFKAIAAGNRELREALLKRVKDCENEIGELRITNQKYQMEIWHLRGRVSELESEIVRRDMKTG